MDIAEDNPPPATPGQLLAASRERQGLSRAEVAQRLHMSPLQIEALESGDFSRLPKGTFLRGFVRNYAKLVGVEPEPLLAGLAQTTPGDAAPRIVVPSQNIRFEPLHERISSSPYVKGGVIAAVVLALGFATMYWWIAIRPTPPAAASAAKRPEPPASQQIAAAPLPAVETPPPTEAPKFEPPAASSAPEPVPPSPAASIAPQKAEAPKAEPAKAAPGAGRLQFRFRGEAWVEVKDRRGKVLISRLNTAGSQAEVEGNPPFTVIVGNAPDVTLFYNDREFSLEPHTKVAVARFTVE